MSNYKHKPITFNLSEDFHYEYEYLQREFKHGERSKFIGEAVREKIKHKKNIDYYIDDYIRRFIITLDLNTFIQVALKEVLNVKLEQFEKNMQRMLQNMFKEYIQSATIVNNQGVISNDNIINKENNEDDPEVMDNFLEDLIG